MPGFDGTGPRGEGMFTGRGEGYCALRLPTPGSGEPAVGYAGMEGRPLRFEAIPLEAGVHPRQPSVSGWPARRCRFGRRRREMQRPSVP